MKLVHPRIDRNIDFDITDRYSLIIENAREFYDITNDILTQTNFRDGGEWVLSENSRILDISKEVVAIYDFYHIDYNNKKIQNLIGQEVIKISKENDIYFKISEINTMINSINSDILQKLDIPVSSDIDFTIDDFIKISDYRISQEDNLVGQICTYVDIFQKLKSARIVVLINSGIYMSEVDIFEMLKQLRYSGVKVLFIDAVDRIQCQDIEKIIVDNDLCVI